MKRQRTAQEKKLADDARLLRAWKNFHREEREAVLVGPHARTLVELFRMFANIECVQPSQLVGFISAIDWSGIDSATRLTVLHELNVAITRHREKRGLTPIDDSVEGEPPFRVIKAILFPERAPTGAKPGMSIRNPAVLEKQT
jgi:hypothetical protein